MKTLSVLCLLIACLLISQQTLSAQWIQTNGPYGGYVKCFVSDTFRLYAGTELGGIFFSENEGMSWSPLNAGLTNTSINALIISGPNILAGTEGGGIFLLAGEGSPWISVNSPHPYVTAFTTLGNITFAGTWNGVNRSDDNGLTWSASGMGNTNISDLLTIDQMLFAATTGKGIFTSSDSGKTWTVSDSGIDTKAIKTLFKDSLGIFAGTGSGTFLSTDKGKSWKSLGLSNHSVYALAKSDTNIVAGTAAGIFLSGDHGSSWIEANSGLTSKLIKALSQKGKKLFAGTQSGGICVSADNGLNWSASNMGLSNTFVTALANKNALLFAGSDGQGIFLSTDYGNTWTLVDSGLTIRNIQSLTVSGDNILAGSGFNFPHSDGGIFLSDDNGNTWTRVTTGEANKTIFCLAVQDTLAIAGSWSGNILFSKNHGKDWVTKNINPAMMMPPIRALIFIDTIIFAATDGKGIYKSLDSGDSWTEANNGLLDKSVWSLAVKESTIFAATINGGIFRSEDYGANWMAVNQGISNKDIRCISIIGSNIFAGASSGDLFVSTDNGLNWSSVNTNLPASDVMTIVAIEDTVFAGIYGFGVLKRPLLEMITSINKAAHQLPSKFILEQNYPNPFNPRTAISYQLSAISQVKLSIYNLLGQHVATLVSARQPAGNYTVEWDATGFASGVYLYKLSTNQGFTQTRKLLLLK